MIRRCVIQAPCAARTGSRAARRRSIRATHAVARDRDDIVCGMVRRTTRRSIRRRRRSALRWSGSIRSGGEEAAVGRRDGVMACDRRFRTSMIGALISNHMRRLQTRPPDLRRRRNMQQRFLSGARLRGTGRRRQRLAGEGDPCVHVPITALSVLPVHPFRRHHPGGACRADDRTRQIAACAIAAERCVLRIRRDAPRKGGIIVCRHAAVVGGVFLVACLAASRFSFEGGQGE